jgi:hypothetical protein
MPSFLDLSPELHRTVLDNLSTSPKALNAFSLVGSHALLDLTRPYTQKILNLLIKYDDSKLSQPLADRLDSFFEDEDKPSIIQHINITLENCFDTAAPSIQSLCSGLESLEHVTTLTMSCINSYNFFGGMSPGILARWILEACPKIHSINITGCDTQTSKEFENMDEEEVQFENLTHVSTRFCNPELAYIWAYHCPNIQILEMEGGEPEKYWEENKVASMKAFEGLPFPRNVSISLSE